MEESRPVVIGRNFEKLIRDARSDIQLLLLGLDLLKNTNNFRNDDHAVCYIISKGDRCFEVSFGYSTYDGNMGRNGYTYGQHFDKTEYLFYDNDLENMQDYRKKVDEIIEDGSGVISL